MAGKLMKRAVGGTLLTVAGALGTVGARWLSKAAGTFGDQEPHNRWLMVTVNCPPEKFPAPDALPEVITRLTDRAEVLIRPAPGGRRTELGLRPLEQPSPSQIGLAARLTGDDPRRELRSAVRDAKSLIEVGEVIKPDEPPTTHPTGKGRLLEFAVRRAGAEGRL